MSRHNSRICTLAALTLAAVTGAAVPAMAEDYPPVQGVPPFAATIAANGVLTLHRIGTKDAKSCFKTLVSTADILSRQLSKNTLTTQENKEWVASCTNDKGDTVWIGTVTAKGAFNPAP